MIIYRVQLSDIFSNELALIVDYIEKQLENRKAAQDFLENVMATVRSLSTFPYRFVKFRNNIRKVSISNYSIFYSVSTFLKTVNILHILYNGRDISKLQL